MTRLHVYSVAGMGIRATDCQLGRQAVTRDTLKPCVRASEICRRVGCLTWPRVCSLDSRIHALVENVGSVYLDFDDTVTVGLSANVQVKAVIEGIAKRMDSVEKAGQFVQERKALIAKLAVEYDKACEQNLEFLISQFPKADFNMDTINAVMDKCAAFDAKWTQVSLDNKVFAGVQRDDFLKIAPQTPLQDNALIAIQALQESGIDVSVTSINWSAEWLQIVLGDRSAIATNGSVPPAGHIKIYSNEMLYENGIATGQLDVLMGCGRDKAKVVRRLMQEAKEADGSDLKSTVFIGDSYYDIQPLLMVDVGIIFGRNAALVKFADHFGIQLKPLSEAPAATESLTQGAPVLYTTDSWLEIAQVLLGEKANQYLSTVSS